MTTSKTGKTGQRVIIPLHQNAPEGTLHGPAVLMEYLRGVKQRRGQSFERWTVVFDNDPDEKQVEMAIILPDYLIENR